MLGKISLETEPAAGETKKNRHSTDAFSLWKSCSKQQPNRIFRVSDLLEPIVRVHLSQFNIVRVQLPIVRAQNIVRAHIVRAHLKSPNIVRARSLCSDYKSEHIQRWVNFPLTPALVVSGSQLKVAASSGKFAHGMKRCMCLMCS